MIPELKWLGDIGADGIRHGEVEIDTDFASPLSALIGCVNAKTIRFAGHIALPETLRLLQAETHTLYHAPSGAKRYKSRLHFVWLSTRAACEDGIVRHVGFNRVWDSATGHYGRVRDAAGNGIFAMDAATSAQGFASLWS